MRSSRSNAGPAVLAGEGVRMARAQPVLSLVTATVVAAATAVALATTGQTVVAERRVLARIDDAGTRLVVVTDERGAAGLTAATVERVRALSTAEWVLGLGPVVDVRNAALGGAGAAVPARHVYGELPPAVAATGRLPDPGEALAGGAAAAALGLELAVGGIEMGTGRQAAVVGGFRAGAPLEFLDRSVLLRPADGTGQVRSIHAVARRPEDVGRLAAAAALVLDPAGEGAVTIETSAAIADIRAAVAGELGEYRRSLVALVLGAGLTLTALNAFAGVALRRKDFGRRRALGARRLDVVGLVVAQSTVAAGLGAALGATSGSWWVWRAVGAAPDAAFTAAVAVLALLAAVVAALAPAVMAAYQDPVRALRVP